MSFPELEVLDIQALESIQMIKSSDGGLLNKLIALYLEESPMLISQIAEGIKNSDVGQVLASAHSLKSTSATLGAMALSDLARQIETMARQSEIGGAGSVLEMIREEHRKVVSDLEKVSGMK